MDKKANIWNYKESLLKIKNRLLEVYLEEWQLTKDEKE